MLKWYQGADGWGNLDLPDVYAASTSDLFPYGTIYREGSRTFVYTKMGATNDSAYRSAGYLLRTKATYKSVSSGMQVAALAATSITVNYGEACALDKYSGGILGVYGTSYGSRFIVSQALAGATYDMVLVLDVGFPVAMATTDNITLLENRYKEVNAYVTEEYAPYVGMIMHHQVTASERSWLQCGGENGMCFYWGSAEGDDGNLFHMFAVHGAVQMLASNTSTAVYGSNVVGACQCIGYRPSYTDADMSGGQQIFLTILN